MRFVLDEPELALFWLRNVSWNEIILCANRYAMTGVEKERLITWQNCGLEVRDLSVGLPSSEILSLEDFETKFAQNGGDGLGIVDRFSE